MVTCALLPALLRQTHTSKFGASLIYVVKLYLKNTKQSKNQIYLFLFLCVCVLCLHVWMCIACMPGACGGQRGYLLLWNRNFRGGGVVSHHVTAGN